MTTVIQLNDADFSGLGLPNIYPYIQRDKLSYAYDFRYGNFADFVTGVDAKAWLSDVVTHTTVKSTQHDIVESSNDLYIKLKYGASISTHKANRSYEVGMGKFSAMMIVGVPTNSKNTATYTNFLEIGNSASSSGIPSIEANLSASVRKFGFRAKSSTFASSESIVFDRLNFITLVYDGTNFIYTNKTTGFTSTVSLASLSITNMSFQKADASLRVDADYHLFGTFGNYGSEFMSSLLLAQTAFWDDTALTTEEVNQQYAMMKAIYNDLI